MTCDKLDSKLLLHKKVKACYGDVHFYDYEESSTKSYLRFIHNSTLFIAEMYKRTNSVNFYKLEKAVTDND